MKYLLFILLCIVSLLVSATPNIDLDSIIQIESSGDPKANSYRGAKYGRGLCQISNIALKDYNNYNKRKYSREDMYHPQKNMKVANWLFETRLPQLLKARGLPLTEDNVLIAYCLGISKVRQWKNYFYARKYLKDYNYTIELCPLYEEGSGELYHLIHIKNV